MSRRRQRPDAANFCELDIKCPHGHQLSSLVLVIRSGNLYQDGQHIEAGQKIKAKCPQCRSNGRSPDYQVSWKTVREAFGEIGDTPTKYRVIELR